MLIRPSDRPTIDCVEALPQSACAREGDRVRRSTPGSLNNGLQGRLRGLQSMFSLCHIR
jgi:hypothetical protein